MSVKYLWPEDLRFAGFCFVAGFTLAAALFWGPQIVKVGIWLYQVILSYWILPPVMRLLPVAIVGTGPLRAAVGVF